MLGFSDLVMAFGLVCPGSTAAKRSVVEIDLLPRRLLGSGLALLCKNRKVFLLSTTIRGCAAWYRGNSLGRVIRCEPPRAEKTCAG